MTKATVNLKTTNQAMPLVGLGTWKIPKDKTAEVVEKSIRKGYRLLDCACDYGNEVEVGEGIKAAIGSGVVKREDIFVTSKLWNTFHAREHVRPAFERTLKDLGLEYLDLYLIHFPISLKYVDFNTRYPPEWLYNPETDKLPTYVDVSIRETWEAMEELVDAGLVKNIGVANFNCSLLMDLLKYARIKPAVNQVEIHPYLAQDVLVEFCHRKEIAITAYSSFGSISYLSLFDGAKDIPSLLEHEIITKIAKKHSKTPAQVLLRWANERQLAVIPKSVSDERLEQNIDLDFKLSEEDMNEIKKLDKGIRFNDPGTYFDCPIFG
ncbi:aldehyde reductase [Basidiobolus meristosporus CBS 931.73]|uniref:Aldehyde reductase n=1 Tax=Basidiobolus meristosporus CBS 931.73 TaxID=1314790 RepID=A0A1Y1XXG0_9FUNG|nr:aldehyde reductase [Basidiobolus meristosporus CBS 931.73]ORX90433.1 aldehyde reductase [Basidiobolus meristosporus CBS 931.73]|eukprot:ORX64150.1 aldehyde reductase [Basidiobolus meristosporus CBS 931.73]